MKRAFTMMAIIALCVTAPATVFAEYLYGESSLSLLVEDTQGNTVADWVYDFPGLTATYTAEDYPSVHPPFTFKLENIHCELMPNPTELASIFHNISLVANVGNTFWFSSQNDALIFDAFVNHLTNPVPGQTAVWAEIGFADSRNSYFAAAGHGRYLSEGLGSEVSRIGVRIDHASLAPPEVPEPSTAAALISGVLLAGTPLLRRHRRSRNP